MEGIIFLIIIFGMYFLPTIVAKLRDKKNVNAILVVNLFFGWTFIGWIIALAWSVMHEEK